MMLNLSLTALVAIGLGLFLGNLLFKRRGGQARETAAALSVATSLFWLTAGIFAVIGGFTIIGMVVIALTFFMVRGNYIEATNGEGIRSRIAG